MKCITRLLRVDDILFRYGWEWYYDSIFLQVEYPSYMDELADIIDCRPHLSDYIFSDTRLFYDIFFGPMAAYQYRLRGPHAWSGAKDAIRKTMYRTVVGPRTRDCGKIYRRGIMT